MAWVELNVNIYGFFNLNIYIKKLLVCCFHQWLSDDSGRLMSLWFGEPFKTLVMIRGSVTVVQWCIWIKWVYNIFFIYLEKAGFNCVCQLVSHKLQENHVHCYWVNLCRFHNDKRFSKWWNIKVKFGFSSILFTCIVQCIFPAAWYNTVWHSFLC